MASAKQIYDQSIELWYEYADYDMKACGHPGVYGPTSLVEWSINEGMLKGAISALQEVINKIEKDRKNANSNSNSRN